LLGSNCIPIAIVTTHLARLSSHLRAESGQYGLAVAYKPTPFRGGLLTCNRELERDGR
jgi:hypothetical protein